MSAAGSSTTHTYASEGSYTVSVSSSNEQGLSANTTRALAIAYLPPAVPVLKDCPTHRYSGQHFECEAQSSDPNGLALTYAWDISDQPASSGSLLLHTFNAPGTYAIKITVTNSSGKTARTNTQISVLPAPVGMVSDNVFSPYCSGAMCSAFDSHTYSGSGIGVWRYHNATDQDRTIGLSISGVMPGKSVALIFSNGQRNAIPTLPDWGALAPDASRAKDGLSKPASSLEPEHKLQLHYQLQEQNRILAEEFIGTLNRQRNGKRSTGTAGIESPDFLPVGVVPPAIGTTRIWNDNYDFNSPVPYTATVHSSCVLKTGRSAVFWVDPNVVTAPGFQQSNLIMIENAFCGPAGGYAGLVDLLGDVWGSSAAQFPTLIQDTAGDPRNINIVMIHPPPTTSWGGYFYSRNNFSSSRFPDSNQDLVFFTNGRSFLNNPQFSLFNLLHEMTHMINFYQRSVARGSAHDSWLEETSAMMAEDMIAPTINASYSANLGNIYGYLVSGAGTSYINWSVLAADHYNMGGAFGAFLNRRYGPSLSSRLVDSCSDGSANSSSYVCLDSLLISKGSQGFGDEFARFGATTLSALPAINIPGGFGYPATTIDNYVLPAISLAAYEAQRPLIADVLSGPYQATIQTYRVDTIAPGKTTYDRPSVTIPANTTLMVVIK